MLTRTDTDNDLMTIQGTISRQRGLCTNNCRETTSSFSLGSVTKLKEKLNYYHFSMAYLPGLQEKSINRYVVHVPRTPSDFKWLMPVKDIVLIDTETGRKGTQYLSSREFRSVHFVSNPFVGLPSSQRCLYGGPTFTVDGESMVFPAIGPYSRDPRT